MNALKLVPARRSEFRVPIVLYHVLVAGMVACLAFAIMQIGQRVSPTWHNGYLIYLSLVIALDGMLTTRLVHQFPLFSPEWLFYRISEWVVILVGMKGLLYVLYNPAQILTDILLWDNDFLNTFFTAEYIATIFFALFIWVVTTQFISILLDLEESVDELEVELEGLAVKDRQGMRTRLMGMIFSVGLVLLIMVAMIHLNLAILLPTRFSLRGNVLMLLGYFLLGFTLMAESEYFILKARWYLQKIPSSPDMGTRWAIYSLLLLFVISVIVILLPTGYSGELFQYLQFGVGILLGLITYLILILSIPFLWLMQLITRAAPGPNLQPPQLIPPPPPLSAAEPDLLLQILKSFVFWTFFLSLIVFSFRYYFGQQRELLAEWKKRPILRWLAVAIEWLLRRWHQLDQIMEGMVQTGRKQLQANAMSRQVKLPNFLGLARHLPARPQVILIYLAMMQWTEHNGLARKRAQTPYEYKQTLIRYMPEAEVEIEMITYWFMEARYTRHEIRQEDAERVRVYWNQLKKRFRSRLAYEAGND